MSSLSIAQEFGSKEKQTIVFAPALGTSMKVWQETIELLSRDFHCVALALPGHVGSPENTIAPESINELALDLIELAESQQWSNFIVAGVSIGSGIAIEMGVVGHQELAGIVVCCGAGKFSTEQAWLERIEAVKGAGTGSLIDFAAKRWFAEGFFEKNQEISGAILNDLLETKDEAYISLCRALSTWDRRLDTCKIEVPSIVISGALDLASTPLEGARLSESMPKGSFVSIPETSHLAPAEAPEVVARLISRFVRKSVQFQTDPRLRGLTTRREVLGPTHVDRAQLGTTPETLPFQDFIAKYAWGELWSSEELDRRSRSIAALSSLVSIGNEHELRLHINAAIRHGLTAAEIGEVFLTAGIYSGIPKANSAFSTLRDVVAKNKENL